MLEGFAPADSDGFVSGITSRDDAGFIAFGGGLLLQSVDFFTPIVDDPYRFGQIAAANAFSDIYAMGGEPLTALNLVAFPSALGLDVLRAILDGGRSKIDESGARLCGGHSVEDDQPKYGVSVTGWVEAERVVRNQGARPGDALVLTKTLGIGILATALRSELVSEADIEDAVEAATRLSSGARDAIRAVGVAAATDVTGYGLLGHLAEMVGPDGHGALVRRGQVPVFERAAVLAAQGCYAGGLDNNRTYLGDRVRGDGVSGDDLLPLYDPQTSGGLLIAVAAERAPALVEELVARGEGAAVVGEVTAEAGVLVVP